MHPLMSISIASYNTKNVLESCLQSILQHKIDVYFEVIVVDNASTDGSVDMVRIKFPSVKLICNETNRGFAAAHNQAFSESLGKYFFLLNSDTIVHVGTIDYLVKFMGKHPRCGAVGCRMIDGQGKEIRTVHPDAGYLWILGNTLRLKRILPSDEFTQKNLGWLLGRHYPLYASHDVASKVDVVDGAAILVRNKAFEEAGGLDDDFFFGSEDGQLCFDLRQNGWEIWYIPEATITHLMHQSRQQIGYQDLSYNIRNHLLLFAKQRGSVGLLKFLMLLCLSTRWFECLLALAGAHLTRSNRRQAMLEQLRAYGKVFRETLTFTR